MRRVEHPADDNEGQVETQGSTKPASTENAVPVTSRTATSPNDAARAEEIREFLRKALASNQAMMATSVLSNSLPAEVEVRIPGQVEVAMHRYRSLFLRLSPLRRHREEAVREQIRWAIGVDERHQGLHSTELEQKLIALTDEARGFVDQVVRERFEGWPLERGTRDTLMVRGKDDIHEEVFVVVQRIREEQGPSYVVYEVARKKANQEMVVLSHAAIDTNTTDESELSAQLRTRCSWKKEGFDSDKHPRAAAIIFNALILNVVKPTYTKHKESVIVERSKSDEK